MKLGFGSALVIFIGWSLLAIVQLWTPVLSGEHFFKVTITVGILLVVVLAIRAYRSEKGLKDDGFLDG